ncbi:uncharacterized protein K489DRAFT_242468 [Dissoconium aciculare CBS 342.82]|jgi:hypothetical protein|uniref:Uncharacterized protein n=1 Tax=Dissoconium aciculare CBS 342.82 TaxID=1314786 RepID=A0A6J3M3E2_9PEZI|nr:uncharacterized protein K489DRAFT_242468 [Dissoconium aciculare CBS 342.82]KAF1822418.1 hypothetical protein K489DRAFT_242468 [Dissoconium aciculare CBS 342.82]
MDYSRCCARTVDLIRKRFSANTPILLGIRGRGRGGTPFDCFFSFSNPLHVSPCRTSRLGECVCVGINVLMMVIQGLMVSVVFPFCPHVGRGLANRWRCSCLHLTRYHTVSDGRRRYAHSTRTERIAMCQTRCGMWRSFLLIRFSIE